MTDRAKAKERDEVLKRMLKMKPKPHTPRAAPKKKAPKPEQKRRRVD